jgi:DNA invertase Pin-like site-specific DNA recombinase
MKFGYIRISTDDQKIDLQMDALLEYGVDRDNIFVDIASGARSKREGLDRMLSKLRRGDQVVVWRLDRLARSTAHISKLIEKWDKEEIDFFCIDQPFFDTKTSHGKFVFNMFSAVAQLERNLIGERTKAGLEAARKRGRKGGRPKGLTEGSKKKAKLAARLYKDKDLSVEQICEMSGIKSKATLYKYLRAVGVEQDGFEKVNK